MLSVYIVNKYIVYNILQEFRVDLFLTITFVTYVNTCIVTKKLGPLLKTTRSRLIPDIMKSGAELSHNGVLNYKICSNFSVDSNVISPCNFLLIGNFI